MRRVAMICVVSVALLGATTVFAEKQNKQTTQANDDDDGFEDDWDDVDTAEPTYPRLEHHGYFRFRADMFSNGHLGIALKNPNSPTLTTSALQPPLTANKENSGKDFDDDSMLAGANMRLRYQPHLLLSESLEISATFDIMDNVVMGSTPDFNFGRADVPISAFSGSQAPPGEGFQFQDSIRVKELYGQWKILGMPVRFGRMSSHWGLGVLANGGHDWDDDYGDYVDRVMAAIQVYGVYVAGGYDIVYSGPVHQQAFQPFGQPYDLTDSDDVQQGFLAIFSKPVSEAEKSKRQKDLVVNHKTTFDWGLYTVYRSQKLDLEKSALDDMKAGTFIADDAALFKRDAWAIVPDLWLRMEKQWGYNKSLRLELEGVMIYGEIGDASVEETTGQKNSRDIMSWGVAFESEITLGGLKFGVFGGAASGDDAEGLGLYGQHSLAAADGTPNKKITNFRFDRNYHVDQILFREVIGAVTNAWYAKPFIQYDLFDSPDGAIGGRLDILVAGAMDKKAYPGDEMFLGTEFDTTFFVQNENNFYADLSFGLLLPGPAFTLKNGYMGHTGKDIEPELAWTLQTHLVMKY